MPRPRIHDTEALLATATALVAAHSPAGLTMAGLAAAAGAPSGSLYHRFGSRDALLGEVRLRAIESFETGFVDALAREPVTEGCIDAARHVVAWSRAHDAEARVLLHAEREFAPGGWPQALTARRAAHARTLETVLADAGARLGSLERVMIATVDLPYAVVRRHLATGQLPADADRTVVDAARALLAGA